MLDHALLDVIGAVRDSLDAVLLERDGLEERFQMDVLSGDISWETSYSVPGEPSPPRARADITLQWPTWSQSSYRSWSIGEPTGEPPEILIEVTVRAQRLAGEPSGAVLDELIAAIGAKGPAFGGEPLRRSAPVIEHRLDGRDGPAPGTTAAGQQAGGTPNDQGRRVAIEVSFEGAYELSEAALEMPSSLVAEFSDLGKWVASRLVRLGDLDLDYLPPEAEPDDG
ncbi:MAG: hypothetical protein ACYDH5_08815 [Acidimicrobiales bacterium]